MGLLAEFTAGEWMGGLAICLVGVLLPIIIRALVNLATQGTRITVCERRLEANEAEAKVRGEAMTEILLGQKQMKTDLGYIKGALPNLNDGSDVNRSQN